MDQSSVIAAKAAHGVRAPITPAEHYTPLGCRRRPCHRFPFFVRCGRYFHSATSNCEPPMGFEPMTARLLRGAPPDKLKMQVRTQSASEISSVIAAEPHFVRALITPAEDDTPPPPHSHHNTDFGGFQAPIQIASSRLRWNPSSHTKCKPPV